MNDLEVSAAWGAVLACGLGAAVALRRAGLARTYVRDLVHVGAGVWVLGWPLFHAKLAPIAITLAAAVATALAPTLPLRAAARLRDALSGGDERWSGVALYTASFAALTLVAFVHRPFPAAAALLALSLGDGIGGAVGRRFGAHHFAAPGGKTKSLEGSLAVFVMAAVGVAIAAAVFGAHVGPLAIAGAAAVAALVEAAAPRGTDNALVPFAVWSLLAVAP